MRVAFPAGLVAAAFLSVSPLALAQDVSAPADEGEPLSELDFLSQTTDEAFESVTEAKRQPVSVTLRALDKITARYIDIEIAMNDIAHFGSLEIQPRTCDKRPPEEFPETTAFLEIFDTEMAHRQSDLKAGNPEMIDDPIATSEIGGLDVQPAGDAIAAAEAPPEVLDGPKAEGVNIFRGWMFASSPALNALEHPVYDVWVIDCQTRIASN